MPTLSLGAAQDEIKRGAEALCKATRSPGWWFRPSGTPHSTATIRAARPATRDTSGVSPMTSTRRTTAIVRPHLDHAGTGAALPQILAGLASRQLSPVTLSRLLRD